jgi:hypothetical protein
MEKKSSVTIGQSQYVPPIVRVMSEAEILSAFQVNAAGTMGWWVV